MSKRREKVSTSNDSRSARVRPPKVTKPAAPKPSTRVLAGVSLTNESRGQGFVASLERSSAFARWELSKATLLHAFQEYAAESMSLLDALEGAFKKMSDDDDLSGVVGNGLGALFVASGRKERFNGQTLWASCTDVPMFEDVMESVWDEDWVTTFSDAYEIDLEGELCPFAQYVLLMLAGFTSADFSAAIANWHAERRAGGLPEELRLLFDEINATRADYKALRARNQAQFEIARKEFERFKRASLEADEALREAERPLGEILARAGGNVDADTRRRARVAYDRALRKDGIPPGEAKPFDIVIQEIAGRERQRAVQAMVAETDQLKQVHAKAADFVSRGSELIAWWETQERDEESSESGDESGSEASEGSISGGEADAEEDNVLRGISL